MNQTKKRLAIIKLAISMTDTETIQLQVLKLGLLKTDSKMEEILSMLNAQNYAQAERLISRYIEAPNDTIVQRTIQSEALTKKSPEEAMIKRKKESATEEEDRLLTLQEKIKQDKDKAIIEEFELFTEDTEEETQTIEEDINYNAFLNTASKAKKISEETIDYDSLLKVEAEDVLADNIALDISNQKENTFFQETHIHNPSTATGNDDFINVAEDTTKTLQNEEYHSSHTISKKKHDTQKTPVEQTDETHYQAISYIDQKLKNMNNQYPPVHTSDEQFVSVETWLSKIANEGYTETDVETIIKKTEQLTQTNKAEAAQLLLTTAATQSKYAHFRLARALFKGDILQKNLAEAFNIINHLALNDNYPEAICDLAQFYEKGIGISKDKKKAETLYKEAMDLGIQRAIKHYERLHKKNKSFFSAFKK